MNEFFSSIKKDKQLLPQIIFVFAAFFVMILIGSIFSWRIIDRNVELYGKEVVNTAGETIGAYLNEYNLILDDIAFALTQLYLQGGDVTDMQTNVEAWTVRQRERGKRYEDFSGFYGVVIGEFVDGSGWDPMNPESEDYDPGYIPQERPWYIGAMNAEGEIYFTDPYQDADTGEYVLTGSKMLVCEDGRFIGVIALDFFLDDVEAIVNGMSLLGSGYGVLLDSERTIIVTYHQDRIGTYFDDVDEAHAEIGRSLDSVRDVVHHNVVSDGDSYVVFFKQIESGWYVGVASHSENYYSDSNTMTLILSVVGLLMALPLCVMLVYLHVRRAKADEANNLKTSFLANMSHEIRTPMNAIIGMTELLQNEQLTEQQDSYVKDINSSAQALLSIINDILDLSKIEAGKIELSPIDYDFPSFVDNVASMFRYVTGAKGLEFKFEKKGELPECLYGDDIRLRQVLTNLCGNAVKFTNEGYVALTVTVRGHEIVFEVKDTGMGIRKDDLPKLFNPFEQFDMQSNRKIVGTGLGLPISKNFVEMMGGTLDVSSTYGRGTTFFVTIPLVLGNKENMGHMKAPDSQMTFTAPDAAILVVDDNEVNLKVASGLLRNLYKIETVTALSGREAITKVKERDFDLVFMDHMMPGMDGVETAAEIRKLGCKYKNLKIIALTANAVAGVKEMFLANGFDGFISKPIDTAQLHEVLLGALPADKVITVGQASNAAMSIVSGSEAFRRSLDAAKAAAGVGDELKIENEKWKMEETDFGDVSGSQHPEGVAEASFFTKLSNVNAINPEIALGRVSGVHELLEETVELFYDKLSGECKKLEDTLGSGDLPSFAISVHALKSALSAVGAMPLSETAFELEKASKGGDGEFCKERLPEFLTQLRELESELAKVFGDVGDGEPGVPQTTEAVAPTKEIDNELLKDKIRQAITACEDFDDAAALEALEPLLGGDFGSDINAALKNAKAAVKDFDYDNAVSTLKEIEGA